MCIPKCERIFNYRCEGRIHHGGAERRFAFRCSPFALRASLSLIAADLLLSDRFILFGAAGAEPGVSSRDRCIPPPLASLCFQGLARGYRSSFAKTKGLVPHHR